MSKFEGTTSFQTENNVEIDEERFIKDVLCERIHDTTIEDLAEVFQVDYQKTIQGNRTTHLVTYKCNYKTIEK